MDRLKRQEIVEILVKEGVDFPPSATIAQLRTLHEQLVAAGSFAETPSTTSGPDGTLPVTSVSIGMMLASPKISDVNSAVTSGSVTAAAALMLLLP